MPSSKINKSVIKGHTNPKCILGGSSIWEDWLMQYAAKSGAAGMKVELLDAQVHVGCPLQVREELLLDYNWTSGFLDCKLGTLGQNKDTLEK